MREKTEYDQINVLGFEVSTCSTKMYDGSINVNAYVTIPNSRYLKSEYLGSDATFRDGDEIGVDTGRPYQRDWTEAKKIINAVKQIEGIIVQCNLALIEGEK